MQIAAMNWMQMERYLSSDNRCVLPIGSIEQHAYLSLATDALLAERVAVEAADPLGVVVFPVLSYGFTPRFTAYPGTVSLTLATFLAVFRDLVASLTSQGFARILVVNGHGGNFPVEGLVAELLAEWPDLQLRFHNWWNAPLTHECVERIEPHSHHASWMENLPWTRIAGVDSPAEIKPEVDMRRYGLLNPIQARQLAGDGNFGGSYRRSDEEVLLMWTIAVAETRGAIEGPWR